VSRLDARIAEWFLIAAEALQKPIVEVPLGTLAPRLLETFESEAVTYNERTNSGRVLDFHGYAAAGTRFGGLGFEESLDAVADAMDEDLLDHHPLVRWHATARTTSPATFARIPTEFTRSAGAMRVRDLLGSFDVREQLSIPLDIKGTAYSAVVLTRQHSAPYNDEDVELARRIQPMFIAFQRQAEILAAEPRPVPASTLLTGQELAVLRCMTLGMTSRAIASRLMTSPRTVEKHVQNAYRKLGVHDRVSAVIVSQELGLISPRPRAGR
jgi:DNA-binding CsgD family transcriptional regulator